MLILWTGVAAPIPLHEPSAAGCVRIVRAVRLAAKRWWRVWPTRHLAFAVLVVVCLVLND